MSAELGLGAAPLGNLYRARRDDECHAIVEAAWDCGIRFFDTAPLYGHGLAERRLGAALAGRPRQRYVVASKAGRVLDPLAEGEAAPETIFAEVPALRPRFDFSGSGIRRSVEESLVRLGLDHLDICHLHDPEDHLEEAMGPAHAELVRLRDEGTIGAIGLGTNEVATAERFVGTVELDWLLLAGRLTLLDRSAEGALLARCAEAGVRVVAAGVFNSGLLADPDAPDATFHYRPADGEVRARARDLAEVCGRYGVALPAAAMQLPARHPAVSVVLVGAGSPHEVRDDHRLFGQHLPDPLWDDLASATGSWSRSGLLRP